MKRSRTPSSGGMDEYLFHQGTNYTAYGFMGCHVKKSGNRYLYTFRTWAPRADSVCVIGDFSSWDAGIPMRKTTDKGIWEAVLESDRPLAGSLYKFLVRSGGKEYRKGDPYAFYSKGGDDGASIVCHPSEYRFGDEQWMAHRKKNVIPKKGHYLPVPLNVYEVHAGSFDRHDDDSYLSYRELADRLSVYVKTMGYTHVELMPITEYPFDMSWGYQVCGYFAPTSRFGDPDGFRYFVDTMHRAGIGVILDWVPAHFPKDEWGLYEFDGHPLYEYQGKDRMESRSWGTRFFDLGREEVRSFLISSALFWLREYHIDGLRVDAVASMIYLDYDRLPGEWIPNKDGNNLNLEAVGFLQQLNAAVFAAYPDALMIAEESTSFGGITHPTSEGGLGFNLKWNMGWANDMYDYIGKKPIYRQYGHTALNFPLLYAFNENYVLPISHDEVVHGKKSLIGKIDGEYEDKFRQLRTFLLLQMTYPGKKMLFMGCEYGQFREWDYEHALEWFMLDYPNHYTLREYVASLNAFYLDHRELWEIDFDPAGFSWIDPDDAAHNLVSFVRIAANGDKLTVVLSFSGSDNSVSLPVRRDERYQIVFSSIGASDGDGLLPTVPIGKGFVSELRLPPFSGFILKKKRISDNPKTNKGE